MPADVAVRQLSGGASCPAGAGDAHVAPATHCLHTHTRTTCSHKPSVTFPRALPRPWPRPTMAALQPASSWTPAVASLIARAASGSLQQRAHPATTAAAAAPSRPHQLDLSPLNGIRACGSILVACFHCWLIWCSLMPSHAAEARLSRTPAVALLKYGGPLAVDFFLVITGMLAAYQLIPLLERPGGSSWAAVLSYWRRRAARLYPALLASNIAAVLVHASSSAVALPAEAALSRGFSQAQCHAPSSMLWNLLGLTNVKLGSSCGLHLWSLALQVIECFKPSWAQGSQPLCSLPLAHAAHAACRCPAPYLLPIATPS